MALLAQYRPRGFGEILDTSFQFYRSQPGAMLAVSIAVLLPPAIAVALAPASFARVIELVGNLLVPIGTAVIALMIASVLEEDRMIEPGEAFRRIDGYGGSVIAVHIMAGLMVIIGLVLVVVPGVLAFIWTAVAVPVVVVERLRASAAITRSRALAKGHAGHVLGTVVLVWIVAVGILVGLGIAIGLVSSTLGTSERASTFLGSVVFIPMFPVIAIVTTLLYYDLRVRHDGADLEAMAAALTPAEPAATA